MRTRASRRALATAGAVAVVASLTLVVLVTVGHLGVVTTTGDSMQPHYSEGDLIVVRRSSYSVGDVVAFRSETLGATVLHRIVERDGDRFTLKGDNNSWIDEDRPNSDEVLGAELFHVPRGGKVLAWLRQPLSAAGLLMVLGMVTTGTVQRTLRPVRRPRRSGTGGATREPGFRPGPARSTRWLMWGSVGVAVTASAVCVAAVSGARPTVSTFEEPFAHRGELTYRGSAAGGLVYSGDEIATGDPVFLNLTDRVEVTYEYSLDPGDLESVRGTMALALRATSGNGWSRDLELLADVPLEGTSGTLSLPLRLDQLRALFDTVESESGVSMGSYLLTLTPRVDLEAVAGGERVTEEFAPTYEFQMDRQQFRPTAPVEQADGGAVLAATASGSTEHRVTGADTASLFGRAVPAATARNAAAAVALLAAVLAAAAFVGRRRVAPRTEADRATERLGHRVIEVDHGETNAATTVIDVASIPALVRIAEHHDVLVLHHHRAHVHTFMVELDGALYRHVLDDRMPPAPAVSATTLRPVPTSATVNAPAELGPLRTPLL